MFTFRFPIALLNYIKADPSRFGYQNTIEKAREWAIPSADEKRVRPTLQEAEEYLAQIIEDDKKEKDERGLDKGRF